VVKWRTARTRAKREAEVAVAVEDAVDTDAIVPDMFDMEAPEEATTKDFRLSPATREVTRRRKQDAVAAGEEV